MARTPSRKAPKASPKRRVRTSDERSALLPISIGILDALAIDGPVSSRLAVARVLEACRDLRVSVIGSERLGGRLIDVRLSAGKVVSMLDAMESVAVLVPSGVAPRRGSRG